MGGTRKPSERRAFTDDVIAGIFSPADLLEALEKTRGMIREAVEAVGMPELQPTDHSDPGLASVLRKYGMDPSLLDDRDRLIAASEWRDLPGVRFGELSMYTHHPLLMRALRAAEILLKRDDPSRSVPPVGVVTEPTFNAAAVRFDPSGGTDSSRAMKVIVVHFHLFLMIVDFAFYQAWFAKVVGARGEEAARRTVTMQQIEYIQEVREGMRTGSGKVPHTPPKGCEYDELVLASMVEGWLAASVGTLFVVLHELGHIHLNHHRGSLADGRSYEMFWMNDDPHVQEYEADEFAAKHLRLLQPGDILPDDIQLNSEEFKRLLVAGVTALFVSMNVLKRPGWMQRLIHPGTHPSPVERAFRVLNHLQLPVAHRRAAATMLRMSSVL